MRRGYAQKGAVGGQGGPCPIPTLGGTRATGENACLRGGRENRVLRGQSGCSHWNVKGAFRIPVISLMKVPGTSKERETGVSSVWDFVGMTLPTVSTVHRAGGPSQLENSRKRMTKK